jgi:signal transduction histidine kinase/ligand-binding sensor domain-containing protein
MTLKPLFFFLICLIFSGCWFSNRPIPLPVNESEFSKPIEKHLKFSSLRKVKWNVVSADSIHPGPVSYFDITKLPSKYFNPGGFNAFLKPVTQTAFQYNSLPDTILNLDAIPSVPLVAKSFLLGTLKKTTLGMPKVRAESYYTSFQYNEEQGLPAANIQSSMQTNEGLLWIATSEGVCILNGESMEILPFNYGTVYYMAEDSLGQVWLRSRDQGVYLIDRKAGIQKQMNFPDGVHLRIDKKGYIWICTFSDGLFIISPDHLTVRHLTDKNGLNSNNTIRTIEDRDGRVWIASGRTGIQIIDPVAKKIRTLGTVQGLSGPAIFSMAENSAGDIYASGFRNGIDVFNIKNGTCKHIDSAQGIKKMRIFNMLEDGEGHMWIATDNSGIYLISRNADSLSHIGSRDGLGDDVPLHLEKDKQDQMYVGTQSGGLNIFPKSTQISHHITKKDGLIDNEVWGIRQDSKKRIWIGTYSGVNIITPDQKIFELVANPGGNNRTEEFLQTGADQFLVAGYGSGLLLIDEAKHTIERMGIKEGLPSNNIFNMHEDGQGRIWLGTVDAGVILFDPHKRTIRFLNETGGLSNNRVGAVMEDSSGKYWICGFGGIDLLDLNENTIRTYSFKEGLSNDLISATLKDKKNRFWISTERGLNLLDPVKETNTIFSVSNGIAANGVYSLMEKDGDIFAGTGKGLTIIKEEKNSPEPGGYSWDLQSYGKPQGFAFLDFNGNAAINTKSNQYWWGIVQGITIMDESVILRDSSPSLNVTGIDLLGKSQYFIDPALSENVDTLWSDVKDTFYSKASFRSLNTDRAKGIEWDSLSLINIPVNLSLPHNRNYIRFHFSNFLPQTAGDYKYRYILDGVDEKWSPVTDQPVSENYNNISPGYYEFRISVKKGDGDWSQPSVFRLRIRPPWWQSWWAELIYFLIFAGLLRLWVRYRSRRLLKENARLEQKVTERTEALSTSLENLRQTQTQLIQAEKMASLGELTAGIAHEIQNPLNFVNNFSEVNTELIEDVNKALNEGDPVEAKNVLKDLEMNMGKITFHGKRADAIVKGMLLHSRASSGQKIPTDINTLADEYLRLSYHGLRAKDKSFNAQFVMDFDENTGEIMLVQQDIGRVLLNLFNNAFYSVTEKKKQVPDGYEPTVTVSTKRKKDAVEIRIRDNGQGISKKVIDKIYQPFFTTKPAGQGTGLGLSLSYDIITKEHSGKIDVVTKENEYTEFIIELPLQPAA